MPSIRPSAFLLLPPLIPVLVHAVVRIFIPGDETLYHWLFLMGAVIAGWVWANTMVDRFRLSFWKTYALSCAVCGGIVASALLAPIIVDHFPFNR